MKYIQARSLNAQKEEQKKLKCSSVEDIRDKTHVWLQQPVTHPAEERNNLTLTHSVIKTLKLK